jgi:hypothetical protein
VGDNELERLGQIDTALQRLGSQVDSALAAAYENASAIYAAERALDRRLDALTEAQEQTWAKLDNLHQDFTSFAEQDRLDKERLIAHTRLISVRAEIKTRFGQYEDVRRNVHGMLLALDAGLAQDATMQLIAETQSINAPNYWLASAQNALAAWIRNDRGAAERALLHASSCSRGKTALFFGLLNARYGRFDATDKWFREYLNDQNPEELSREFGVVLNAAMFGLLGDTTYDRVSRQCRAWFERLRTRDDIVEQQVSRWQSEIAHRREPASGPAEGVLRDQCQTLANFSPDWPRVMSWYRDATAFGPMKRILSAQLDLPRADESAWRDRIDVILRELHTIHEPEESDLRGEEAHLQRIIEHKGDIAAADRARKAEALVDEPQVDLLTFLTNVALHPQHFDASQETTQLAIHLAAPWISQAGSNIVAETRTRSAAPVIIEIDEWSGELGSEPVDSLARTLTEMVDGQTKKEVARERFAWRRLVAALVAIVSLAFMAFELTRSGAVQLWPVVVLACIAGVSLLAAVVAHRHIPKRTRRAEERGKQRKQDGLATLRTADADHKKLLDAWNERIREADRLIDFVESVTLPELRLRTPYQRPRTDGSRGEVETETLAPSPRSRNVDRLQPPFVDQVEWSLEPVWTERRARR